jgi:mono/diheme cytochrome c family protein
MTRIPSLSPIHRFACAALLALPLLAPPAAVADAAQVARGQYLATAGNCASCHTREGGAPLAGGVAFHTEFGTIYSTNITPDRGVGIGAWTEAQFVRAMREGVAADGTHLYPAFPYTAFTKVSDADLAALWAWLKTVAPSSQAETANELRFPYNQRALLGLWKMLYFEPARFAPQAGKSAEWNRGAYLVEGLGHCGACHTPRNFLGAEIAEQALAGGSYLDRIPTGEIRPWSAVNLTSAQSGLKSWSVADLAEYLTSGHGPKGASTGPMNEVIGNSTRQLSPADVRAMSVYIKSLPPIELSATHALDADARSDGETLYTIHCGTCHLPTGLGSTPGSELGPPLAGNPIVQAADPSTLINVILYTSSVLTPMPPKAWMNMEGLGDKLDDDEVAAIATYLRTSWGNRGGPVTTEDVARQR